MSAKSLNKTKIKCGKCKNNIPRREFLTCAHCSLTLDLGCANVPFVRYNIMDAERKKKWRCDKCLTKHKSPTPKTITDGQIPTTSNDTTPFNEDFNINITTHNSFEYLSEDDYTDISFLTQGRRLHNSCPNSPNLQKINMMEKIEKLENENKKLKEKLQIADNEIENMLIENSNLKQQLANLETKTKLLTEISSSSEKNITHRRKRKSVNKTTLEFSLDDKEQNHCTPSRMIIGNHLRLSEQSSTPSNESGTEEPICAPDSQEKNKVVHTHNKPMIHILGDEQISGLAEDLMKTRCGKWNDNYNVSSMVKPFAPSTEILKSSKHLQNNIKKNDILILSLGNNDENPYTTITNLCNILGKFYDCKIFLLSVLQNNTLNVQKLNAKINLIANQYNNCTFINIIQLMQNNEYNGKICIRTQICKKLNIEIDYIKYSQDYIKNVCQIIKTHKQKKFCSPKNETSSNLNKTLYKKGKIPYYFPPKKILESRNQIAEQEQKKFFR